MMMKMGKITQGFESEHRTDKEGYPAGGISFGRVFFIKWQNGPLGRGDQRKEPNGATLQDVLAACIDRLEFYQSGKCRCEANVIVIDHLRDALGVLEARTAD